ncbi:DUF1345 domain-containing protein [Rhodobacter ferrooxidans]|uniref:Transmembrane protein n=1 Tax=Rhodobacter ferrooxidans TaxID=371731 RepID=C8RYW2_9RHOB|nr:DUF1345 domain-containing protein [Rhodobacter sp. SW2]EEW25919.1 protein of unknown function DUF1345 [Rhodobacter sp. SW2]
MRHPRFLVFLAVLALVGGAAAWGLGAVSGIVIGFDAAAAVFLATCLPLWLDDHPDRMRARAARDDGGRGLLLLVSVSALVVVVLALAQLIGGRQAQDMGSFALLVGTLLSAWLFVNLVFAFHYAHVFYDQAGGKDVGGLGFPGAEPPIFADFCYFSFVIGMTSQVSDVPVLARSLRRVVMVQGIIAFLFNLGVLALTVNVLAAVL